MIQKPRIVTLTQKLLAIDSQNPPGNEVAIADFVAKEMRGLGLDIKIVMYKKNRPNVIATLKGSWPRVKAAKEALLLTPHIDTVPIGNGWTKDPFGKDIVGNKIYGRGATDDKGSLASAMEAIRSLVEDGVRLKKDVILAATADEETGSQAGIVPLLKKRILKPKFALVLDSVDYDTVIAQKGLLHMRIQVQGKKAHGATNWRGVNAIEQAAEIIVALKKLTWKFKKHAWLNHPTLNIGTIKGGDKVNIVADECEFSIDFRFMPGMDYKKIITIVKKEISSVTKKFKFFIDDLQQPYEVSEDNLYVKAFMAAGKKMKQRVHLRGSDGATVMTFFQDYDIAAFATGFGKTGTLHVTDEYAEISTLYNGARILEQFIKDYDEI